MLGLSLRSICFLELFCRYVTSAVSSTAKTQVKLAYCLLMLSCFTLTGFCLIALQEIPGIRLLLNCEDNQSTNNCLGVSLFLRMSFVLMCFHFIIILSLFTKD